MPRGYRFNAKGFFLTFPQCDVSKEEALSNLLELRPCEWAVVGRERHADGNFHLHICGAFEEKVNTVNPHYFDVVTGQHGSYETMRNKKKAVEYVTKDGDFLEYKCCVEDILKGKSSKRDVIARMIMDGKEDMDIVAEHPGYVMEKLHHMNAFRSMIEKEVSVAPTQWLCPTADVLSGWGAVTEWLKANLLAESRPLRSAQLWLYGPPRVGKTDLWMRLVEQGIRVYNVPYEDWYDEYHDDAYDLIIFDEFRGQKSIYDMNRLIDGQHAPLRRRGRAPYLKKRNIPAIIVSNYSVADCYKKADLVAVSALMDRVQQVEVHATGLDWDATYPVPDVVRAEDEGPAGAAEAEELPAVAMEVEGEEAQEESDGYDSDPEAYPVLELDSEEEELEREWLDMLGDELIPPTSPLDRSLPLSPCQQGDPRLYEYFCGSDEECPLSEFDGLGAYGPVN